ncbi:hypothetical protein LCGC14_0866520 [marine sediment metagenome]|uniref:Uncharacterized protein n=1 Tax=marine sediment metagenome TaxID=412755 RepID=A0A0F9SCX9_9ZZZZ
MNRRNFLKRCSILPFVGSLAAVAKAEATDGSLGCDPCYDDCPHYQQCYGSDTDCDGGNARERTIQMLIDTLNIGNFEPSYPRYMWMSKDCLRRFKSAGIIPKHIEFGKEYNGLIIIKEQEYFVDN